jgi:hypothetical protein
MRQGDSSLVTWFLAWWPHAILRGQNPFFTTAMNYPIGINMADNVGMALLSLLTAPLTLTAGPIASLNLLDWLAFPVSAAAMYFVLRRYIRWPPAAFFGGALYGFSPYVVGQGLQHVFIAIIPLPPLIFMCVVELLVLRSPNQRRWGVALGLLVVAQFFISQEIAVTTVGMGAIGLGLLALVRPRSALPALRHAMAGLVQAIVIVIACLAYPFWADVAGPEHYTGAAHLGGLSADLLGSVLPTSQELFAPASWLAIGNKLLAGNVAENGSYLSLPILALAAFFVFRYRRDRWIRYVAALMVTAWVLTLGWRLVIDGTQTSVPLPWSLFQNAPVLQNLLAARITLFVWLFASLLIALGLDRAYGEFKLGRSNSLPAARGLSPRARSALLASIVTLLTCASLVALIPRWPYSGTGPAGVPSYFSSGDANQIPLDSVVLISPYPVQGAQSSEPLLWQAVAGFRFKILGGYGEFALPNGAATGYPAELSPLVIEDFLGNEMTGEPGFFGYGMPQLTPTSVSQFRLFLRRYRVGTVLDSKLGLYPAPVYQLFAMTLGPPSASEGSIIAWYGVQKRLRSNTK